MRLPLELIKDNMDSHVCTLSHPTDPSKEEFRTWYQLIYYQPDINYEHDFLLYGRADDFPREMTGMGIVCLGKPSPQILENNDVLYFDEDIPFHETYLQIQKIYLKFDKWEEALRGVLNSHPSLDALFLLAAEVFENPVCLHDENFNLLSSVNEMPGQMAWEYDRIKGCYVLPLDVLNDFKVNQDYLDTMPTVGPCMFPAYTFGYRILYQNLRYNGQYRGRICVNEMGRKIRSSDYFLLDHFSQIVLESFRVEEIAAHKHTFSLSRFLICLIEREAIDSETLNEILLQYGWTSGDEYFCACLFPEERDIRTNSIQYFCSRISNEFPHACAFCYGQSIVILVNSTLSELTIPGFRNQIGIMLRESLMKAGISCVCSDLTQFYYIYRQAVCALETGKKRQDTFWSYCFEDYQTDFVFQNALKEFPAEMLCCKEIFYLKNYDGNHTSELGKTLKIYLENDRNLARTSEILDIHRSTLLYRIGKIREITGINLDDPKNRFRLLMSYYFLDENNGQL